MSLQVFRDYITHRPQSKQYSLIKHNTNRDPKIGGGEEKGESDRAKNKQMFRKNILCACTCVRVSACVSFNSNIAFGI